MAKASLQDSLDKGLQELPGVEPSAPVLETLLAFVHLLERWNRSYNLTAVRDPSEMVFRHVLDSLTVLPWVGSGRLLDAGTGGGLPGVPLAIARPELAVTLLDSAGKKIRFLNHVKRELGLDNVMPVQSRLEACSPGEPFDTVISRAISSLESFAAAARHLCLEDTRLLAMKGRVAEGEIGSLTEWVSVDSVEKLKVPGLHEDRQLVFMSVIA